MDGPLASLGRNPPITVGARVLRTSHTYIHTEERREIQKRDRIENGECRIEQGLAVYTETDCTKCRHQNQRLRCLLSPCMDPRA